MKGGKANLPVYTKVAVKGDVDDYISSLPNEAPKLYLFFDSSHKFQLAEVAADRCTIHLQAHDIVAALFLYIGCFYVFHVGYNEEVALFLGLLQHLMLGLPFEKGQRKGKNYIQFLHKFDQAFQKLEDSNKFKKFCV